VYLFIFSAFLYITVFLGLDKNSNKSICLLKDIHETAGDFPELRTKQLFLIVFRLELTISYLNMKPSSLQFEIFLQCMIREFFCS
jgi:hypothetical protein